MVHIARLEEDRRQKADDEARGHYRREQRVDPGHTHFTIVKTRGVPDVPTSAGVPAGNKITWKIGCYAEYRAIILHATCSQPDTMMPIIRHLVSLYCYSIW
jgi:hypothetical protein